MNPIQIAVLAVIQGLAELLPISSSAHVIVAEKLMGLDPTNPQMTLLLVALHTGTMLAVLFYFWNGWKEQYFQTKGRTSSFLKQVLLATLVTLAAGVLLIKFIEKVLLRADPNAEIESLFGDLSLVSAALAAAGALILYASMREPAAKNLKKLGPFESMMIGLVQGLCLPFRGFSRSGATISTGLILGIARQKAEDFSFALAVAITPFALGKEILRLWKTKDIIETSAGSVSHLFIPGLLGMVLSFLAGLVALKWLSIWLEKGRWNYFGFYCVAAAIILWLIKSRI